MALDEYQQAHTFLGASKNILLIAGHKTIDDAYPTAIALSKILNHGVKNASLFTIGSIPNFFYFLQNGNVFQKTISGSRELIITIDTAHAPIKQLSYRKTNSQLNVYVTPEDTTKLTEQDIHISMSKFSYDLIVTLGLEDLGSLGEHFENNAQLFYETPIVNIDVSTANERYGQVNLIESTMGSCSEVVISLLKKWDDSLINKEVATSLLAGIIATTSNFQNSRTKPNSLFEAAYLMSRKADQQEIVKNLFKTKSFEILKLFGIALAKLKILKEPSVAWTTLSAGDFLEAGADTNAVPLLIAELKNNLDPSSVLTVFWEENHSFRAVTYAGQEEKIELLTARLEGAKQGNNIFLNLESNKMSEQERVINEISRALEKFAVK